MKRLFLATVSVLSLSAVWGQSVVGITQLSHTEGAVPTLTFHVGWTTAPTPPDHRDTVWIFADVRTVNPDGSTGHWTAATITGATTTAGTLSFPIALPYRGFYLAGNPSGAFDAAMTVTLAAPANTPFNVCAYASDYPPNATQQSGGGYALRGTPPFVINGTTREPSYMFDDAGVCITSITDSTGCPGFVVNQPIVPGAIPTTGETVCAGGTPTTIVGLMPFSGGDGQLAYSWYKDGVLIADATGADNTPPPADAATAGTYTYTRKVNDRTCGLTPLASTGSWTLTVEEAPAVTTTGPARCGDGTVTLTATPANATSSTTYSWIVGGAAAVTTPANTYTTDDLSVGPTTYSVTVTNSTGCVSAAAYGTVTVHTAVSAATITGDASNTCPAATVSLTASATGATSFTWYKEDSQVQTGTRSTYTVTSSGSYTVQGKNAHCTGTTSPSREVTINDCREVPGCPGLRVYQTTSPIDGSGAWSTADTYCRDRGARLPTRTELECMCDNRASLSGGYTFGVFYWSSTPSGSVYYHVGFVGSGVCTTGADIASSIIRFRCVL
ncbi:MAG: hypothetical protein LBF90_01725 [Prevotellaceae bacterium]|jgi:hypothetical protein|nr:hypothetical protein [Prevotellaceae bacterium]